MVSQAVRYVQYFVYQEMTMMINKLHPSHLTYCTYKLDEFDEYDISLSPEAMKLGVFIARSEVLIEIALLQETWT